VIEGYFDELGYREMEGPYGEFYGYYGSMHIDPVFHATAITMRRDAMFQTVLHAGRFVGRMDSANLASLNAEVNAWRALRAARLDRWRSILSWPAMAASTPRLAQARRAGSGAAGDLRPVRAADGQACLHCR
jgi:hypothetical protein